MADPKPIEPGGEPEAENDDTDAARVRSAIGAGLRKFYDQVADEPIPAEWLELVGLKPDEPES
jgi:Anti-sigma factor NepR